MTGFFLMILTATAVIAAPVALKVKVLGFPDAVPSGTLNRNVPGEPQNLNPIQVQEQQASDIQELVMQGLLQQNPETWDFEPCIAESYEASKDGLKFTFHLRKDVKFSDGHPLTSEDVKFSIDSVRDPAYGGATRMPYFDDVEAVEAPDAYTVVVKMKRKYFKNLEVLSTWSFNPIVPKHIYGDPKRKWDGAAPLIGSGAYKVETYNRGKNIMLVREKNWWGDKYPDQKSQAKFEHINFRFINDQSLELEMVKKDQIDLMWPIRADNFEQRAVGEPFGTKIAKIQTEDDIPKSWGFIAWNLRNPMFQDRDTRVALQKLMNRELFVEKFGFGKSTMVIGPFYFRSEYNPPGAKAIGFDPKGAKALLTKAGWKDENKDGILEKKINGVVTPFSFTLLFPNKDIEKYMTIYKEDLKNAGVDMTVKLIDWPNFSKLLEEQKFEAMILSWGGGSPEDDLKQIWHSESARLGGSNFVGYSNKNVDKWIDQARQELDREKRKVLWRKVSKQIIDDAPYAFMMDTKYTYYLLNKRIQFDKPTYRYYYSRGFWKIAPQ